MSIYKKTIELLEPQEQKQLLFLLFLIFVGMLLETLGIGFLIPALALMTQKNLSENYPIFQTFFYYFPTSSPKQLVICGMLALSGLYFLKTIFLLYMSWKQNKFIADLQVSLSNRLFSGYLSQPWIFHLQRNSAQLLRNVTTEVNLFASASQASMMLLTECVVLLGIVALLLIIEPVGATTVISVLASAGWLFQRSIRSYVLHLGEARQYDEGMRFQHLQQGLGGVKDVKLLGRERNFLLQYGLYNKSSAEATRMQKTMADLPRLWLELLAVVGLTILVLLLLAKGTVLNELLPILGLFAAAAFRIAPSANRLLGAMQNLRYCLPVIDILHTEMQILNGISVPKRQIILPFKNEILLENIGYQYKNAEHQVFKYINLTVKRGAAVGFIGTSGVGKSTLVDVILGLLTPVEGHVKVDGIDIQTNLRGWQDQIGYVPQSIFLTDDTLRRNIAFGLPDSQIDDGAVFRALKAAQLDAFVDSLSLGVETMVGERGVRLSGGQRQRIGIARALYHDPAVLILDEATSALDTETEKDVMSAINELHGEKTLLIVAHRLSTVENCDYVYRLEKGGILKLNSFSNLNLQHEFTE
jgi:ABC-type multidrug transport system fused ATPase/permease subunit